MAHARLKRQEVRDRYIKDRQPLTAAARGAGVNYSTARQWKAQALARGDDWDNMRNAEDLTDSKVGDLTRVVLQEFIPMFQRTIADVRASKLSAVEQAEVISRLSDAYTKTVKAAGAIDPKVARLAWALDILKALGEFVQTRFPQHAPAMLEILQPFGEHLAEQYG